MRQPLEYRAHDHLLNTSNDLVNINNNQGVFRQGRDGIGTNSMLGLLETSSNGTIVSNHTHETSDFDGYLEMVLSQE